jgi:hypothetical protein
MEDSSLLRLEVPADCPGAGPGPEVPITSKRACANLNLNVKLNVPLRHAHHGATTFPFNKFKLVTTITTSASGSTT